VGDVSFLGLGDMGFALANTIAKAGYDTIVWNRTKERAAPLLEHGARLASSPAEAISFPVKNPQAFAVAEVIADLK
jgi:3-hydroxyisobutyrate dehydrogenase-like beta-hydroxyacid dehydrogenase